MSQRNTPSPPPPSVVPSKSQQRYDRQLRLWGDHGQEALENANVCVINATALGTETLKNLVLPGLGRFTIVDDNTVKHSDLGSNFFLREEDIGKHRAEAAVELLVEMNDSVNGTARCESFSSIFAESPQFFLQFSIVYACDVAMHAISELAAYLWKHEVTLAVGKSWGMFGQYQLFVREHEVIEAHIPGFDDLRLDDPFPELLAHAQEVNLDELDDEAHEHVPFPVIILQLVQQWKATHEGATPSTYKEKKEFAKFLWAKNRANSSGDEPNFKEAKQKCNSVLAPYRVPDEALRLFEDDKCTNLTPETSDFWWICAALKSFLRETARLPLAGSIPDMEGDSKSYVRLQQVYKAKAEQDIAAIQQKLSALAKDLAPQRTFSDSVVARYCKNARYLSVVSTSPLAVNALREPGQQADAIKARLDDGHAALLCTLFYACDSFHAEHGRWPGDNPESLDTADDVKALSAVAGDMLAGMGADAPVPEDLIKEICRHGASHLHTTAAFLGGVASQEMIKLITHQYVPANNTIIYNGITSTSTTFAL